MIPVFFDCFPIKTRCFTCHSCDFWFWETFGCVLFVENSLKTFSESLQGTLEEDIEAPTVAPREDPVGPPIETRTEATIEAPIEAPAEVPKEALTEALRGLLRRFPASLSKEFSK